MRKLLAGLVAAFALTLGLVAIDAAPAAAAWNACPTGQGAIFVDINGGGAHACIPFSMYPPPNCYNFTSTWNDTISSVRVTYGSGYGIRLWKDANCPGGDEGDEYITVPHLMQTNLTDDPRQCGLFGDCTWNDVVSSFKIVQA